MSNNQELVQFSAISSFIQSSFWNKFADLKINVDKLSETEREIWGYFPIVKSHWTTNILEVDSTSFNLNFNEQSKCVAFHGKIFNKNTIEQFKNCDKTALINKEGTDFLQRVIKGEVLEKPSLLNNFFILAFSDFKKYQFYYWFGFPVPYNFQLIINKITPINKRFTQTELEHLSKQFQQLDQFQKSYFLVEKQEAGYPKIYTLISKLKEISEKNYENFYFGFCDYICENYPRSQLKNYLILILHYCDFLRGKQLNFIQFTLDQKFSCAKSQILHFILPEHFDNSNWVGWEKNEKNNLGPRLSNMKAIMDPKILFEESNDINLKLMKWRLVPNIDLEKIKNNKWLLLGAGTLGCSVARTLLGWGVKNITLIDNSMVSFSNPARQVLYKYEDALKSRSKIDAAIDSLTSIVPNLNCKGYHLTIPMPGHSISESTVETTRKSVETLENLIKENDFIFLLTDSRESRWLPTLLGCFYGKNIINVALGFDSYLVMRYGGEKYQEMTYDNPEGYYAINGADLGCYFCNDVTAPGNSLKDRTLDQQCTVTRPGVSPIAGALAVELAISLTQHPKGMNAPAFCKLGPKCDSELDADCGGLLGLLPHSIRGFLTTYTQILPATKKYTQCVACSDIILEEFRQKGFEFLCDCFNSSTFLEDLTGLSQLQNDSNFVDVSELSDDSSA